MMNHNHNKSQIGSIPILVVLMLTFAIGGYVSYQHIKVKDLVQSAEMIEAQSAGLEANKAAITLAKSLLEFPNGALYQDPYYPVTKVQVRQYKPNNSPGIWSYDERTRTLSYLHPSFHLNPKKLTTVVSKVKFVETIFQKSSPAPVLVGYKVRAISNPKVRNVGRQKGNRRRKIVTEAEIAFTSQPPPPVCRIEFAMKHLPFPALCKQGKFSVPCTMNFLPWDHSQNRVVPKPIKVYCSGVVTEAFVANEIGDVHKLVKRNSYHLPYPPAASVFGRDRLIGTPTVWSFWSQGYFPVQKGVPKADYSEYAWITPKDMQLANRTPLKNSPQFQIHFHRLTPGQKQTLRQVQSALANHDKAKATQLLKNVTVKREWGNRLVRKVFSPTHPMGEAIRDQMDLDSSTLDFIQTEMGNGELRFQTEKEEADNKADNGNYQMQRNARLRNMSPQELGGVKPASKLNK